MYTILTDPGNREMNIQAPNSDGDLLDLLRVEGAMGVTDMAHATEVTATAVRQRLMRLMAHGLIQREAIRSGRGRPKHLYQLTSKGMRLTGSNFTDLALVLWREIQSIPDREEDDDLPERVATTLARQYAHQIHGGTTAERMRSLAELLAQRRIPASVDHLDSEPALTTHACPYPELAEEDPSICKMEKQLFSKLLAREVELVKCRLEEGVDCRFQVK